MHFQTDKKRQSSATTTAGKKITAATSEFEGGIGDIDEDQGPCRLKRVNTPHYKSQRGGGTIAGGGSKRMSAQTVSSTSSTSSNPPSGTKQRQQNATAMHTINSEKGEIIQVQ